MGKMKIVSFKIDDDLYELLEAYAKNHKIPRSVTIRRAIELLLKKEKILT